MSKKQVDFTGSVSEATMRPQDVLPAIMDILSQYHLDAYTNIATIIEDEFNATYFSLLDNENHSVWESETMSYLINEDAWNAMQEIAPEGHYFGSHPGNGSDYGFWPVEEML